MGGFVYMWYDKRDKRFYLGSHFGNEKDSYRGSGIYFIRVFNKRPNDFKRRIIQTIIGSKQEVMQAEQKWLDLIPTHQLGKRYYNLKKYASGGSIRGRKISNPRSEEYLAKLRKPKLNKENYKYPKSTQHKNNISKGLKACILDHSGSRNPNHSGVTNEEFREEYLRLCKLIGYQPSMSFFRTVFKLRTNKQFPLCISMDRFNKGQSLFEEAESLGYLRARSSRGLNPSEFLLDA